jgi:hypothetical protein
LLERQKTVHVRVEVAERQTETRCDAEADPFCTEPLWFAHLCFADIRLREGRTDARISSRAVHDLLLRLSQFESKLAYLQRFWQRRVIPRGAHLALKLPQLDALSLLACGDELRHIDVNLAKQGSFNSWFASRPGESARFSSSRAMPVLAEDQKLARGCARGVEGDDDPVQRDGVGNALSRLPEGHCGIGATNGMREPSLLAAESHA